MLGIDVVDTTRFARLCPGPSCTFARAMFTREELRLYGGSTANLALCFSAKEAVGKALGTGLALLQGPGVPASSVEVLSGAGGTAPRAVLHGAALTVALQKGYSRVLVTWRRRGGLAISLALAIDRTEAA